MKKTLGILGVVIVVLVFTSLQQPRAFLNAYNVQNILQRTALAGILGLGVCFVIIGGGIDLSIGSVVGLVGCMVPLLIGLIDPIEDWLGLPEWLCGWAPLLAIVAALALTALLGLFHGLLITKMRLQPFVVTLCGLLLYRGAARYVAEDRTLGWPRKFEDWPSLANGKVAVPLLEEIRRSVEAAACTLVGAAPARSRGPLELPVPPLELPVPLFILLGLGVLAAIFLNRTIFGRYLFAIGRNEQAARYSGINTDRMVILSYVLCAVLAGGVGGILYLFFQESVQPDAHGNFYELYAIAAAVLGGCSLRGGEGSIVGVILGAALITVLYNAGNILGIPTTLEFATMGFVILAGAIVDETVRRLAAARQRRREGR